jgi:hypothetical protein
MRVNAGVRARSVLPTLVHQVAGAVIDERRLDKGVMPCPLKVGARAPTIATYLPHRDKSKELFRGRGAEQTPVLLRRVLGLIFPR